MTPNIKSSPDQLDRGLPGSSPRTFAGTGEVEIAGRRYVTADRLAKMLGVSVRTLARWHAERAGPPKIKRGKLVLFDISKLPDYLASHETDPVRAGRREGRAAP